LALSALNLGAVTCTTQGFYDFASRPRIAVDGEDDAGVADCLTHDCRIDVSVVEPHVGTEMTPIVNSPSSVREASPLEGHVYIRQRESMRL